MTLQSPTPKREFVRQLVAERLTREAKREQPRGCGRCRWCLGYGSTKYPCPHTADASDEQAVTAMAE